VVIRNNRAVVLLAMGCPASARREAGAAAARAAGGVHAAAVAATWGEVEAAGASDAPGCPADDAWAHSLP
jgi:hypothetical protein